MPKPREFYELSGPDKGKVKIEIAKWAVQPDKRPPRILPIHGIDTETGREGTWWKGRAVLASVSDGRLGKPVDSIIIRDCFSFLDWLTQRSFTHAHNFFYNLNFDGDAITKWLPPQNGVELAKFNTTDVIGPEHGWRIKSIPRKSYSVGRILGTRQPNMSHFYDISQFYPTKGLVNTFNKVLGNKFGPYEKIEDAKHGFSYEDITPSVIRYCEEDAMACQRLAEHFVRTTEKFVRVRRYYSPASLAKAFVKSHLRSPYKFQVTPLAREAFRSFAGGRIEVVKKGYFDRHVWMYDINSAYPSIYQGLADVKGPTSDNPEYEPDSVYSYFNVDADVPDCYISPIKTLLGGKYPIVYPKGPLRGIVVTKGEYETMLRVGCDVRINSAVHMFDDEPTYPFDYVQEVYDLRLRLKKEDPHLANSIKLCLNSMYGICCQLTEHNDGEMTSVANLDDFEGGSFVQSCLKCGHVLDANIDLSHGLGCKNCGSSDIRVYHRRDYWRTGSYFNPVWATEVTSRIRCRLFEDALRHERDLIFLATDCMALTHQAHDLPFSTKLGDYSDSPEYHGLVVGCGVYSMHTDDPKVDEKDRHKVHFRGFGNEDILKMASENRELPLLEYRSKPVPRHLKECINDLERINVFEPREKSLDPNFDSKRVWDGRIEKMGDLLERTYDSVPLMAGSPPAA